MERAARLRARTIVKPEFQVPPTRLLRLGRITLAWNICLSTSGQGAIWDSSITNESVTLLRWNADFIVRQAFLQPRPRPKTRNSRNAGTNVQSAGRIGSIRCLTRRILRLTATTESVLIAARRHSLRLLGKLACTPAERIV
jgi:hypothetical protein